MSSPASAKQFLGVGMRYWIFIPVVILTLLIVKEYLLPPPPPPVVVLRECPHTWHLTGVWVSTREGTSHAPVKLLGMPNNDSTLSGPGRNTNIPEYHDCQRFIVNHGNGPVYDSLYALFASQHLDTIFGDSQPQSVALGVVAVPAAEILSLSGSYEPLHIQPGFNCLYLQRRGTGWAAWMVPSGHHEVACDRLQKPADFAAVEMELQVRQVDGLQGYQDHDFPPVARWDWDPRAGQQVIGLKCGTGWCEVGSPDGFSTMRPPALPAGLASAVQAERRVYEIKGWYDEQELASVENPLRPSGVRGTFIPDPKLGELNDKHSTLANTVESPFYDHWTRVAEAYLSADNQGYRDNFNLGMRTPDGRGSTFNLCFGGSGECSGADVAHAIAKSCTNITSSGRHWWLRIDDPDGRPIYRCVSRMGNPDGTITPATARWRWNLTDETTWVRCTSGCCQGGA